MAINSESLITSIVGQLVLAEDLDQLHLGVTSLLDSVDEGEIDLVLEQADKSAVQKTAFLEKLLTALPSQFLREALETVLKDGNLDFFSQKFFPDFLHQLQHAAEAIEVVKLTVACRFKPTDLQEMTQLLGGRVGHPVAFSISVDSNLIAGAVIQHGTYISDYSLRTRLTQFREHWRGQVNALEEISA